MSSVDIDLRGSANAIGTDRVAAEDLGFGGRKVGDLSVIGRIRGIPEESYTNDLVLNRRRQFLDRIVQNSGALTLEMLIVGYEE